MKPVKLNVYISYAAADKKAVEKLRDWLYPMRDEVNIWYYDPPKPPKPLSVPWELIASVLPFFRPHDNRKGYDAVDRRRKERAHVYLFMTSYQSLMDSRVDNDITLAVQRRIEGDWLSPHIYPVVLAPSLWKQHSRLARYKPIGPAKKTLAEIKPEEEGYLEITEELSKVINKMQRDMNEAKYAALRVEGKTALQLDAGEEAKPYLGGEEDLLEYKMAPQLNPPEWLGWMIIFFLLISVARGLRGDRPTPAVSFYETDRPSWQPEFERELPMIQPEKTPPFRPAE